MADECEGWRARRRTTARRRTVRAGLFRPHLAVAAAAASRVAVPDAPVSVAPPRSHASWNKPGTCQNWWLGCCHGVDDNQHGRWGRSVCAPECCWSVKLTARYAMLCCTVLCYAMLCCAVLCCAAAKPSRRRAAGNWTDDAGGEAAPVQRTASRAEKTDEDDDQTTSRCVCCDGGSGAGDSSCAVVWPLITAAVFDRRRRKHFEEDDGAAAVVLTTHPRVCCTV
jgi:hypothetical protein